MSQIGYTKESIESHDDAINWRLLLDFLALTDEAHSLQEVKAVNKYDPEA